MRPSHRAVQGASLVEVLVAVFVVSVGILGVAALQGAALRSNQSASERTQGIIAAYSILESLRANRDAALAGDFDLALDETPGAGNSLAERDLRAWRTQLAGNLAGGNGAVDCSTDAPVCEVVVQWDDSRAVGGQQTETLRLRSQL